MAIPFTTDRYMIMMAAAVMHMSATLKIGQYGNSRKSITWPRSTPGGRNNRSVRFPATPAHNSPMTDSAELLEALPRHETAHAALLAEILDVLHGSSLAAKEKSSLPPAEELSPGELRVLRYLPTNLSRPEIASELSVSLNTVSTHVRSIYAKLQVRDRSSAVQRARELRLLAAGRTR